MMNLEKTHKYLKKTSKSFSYSFNEQKKGKLLKNFQMEQKRSLVSLYEQIKRFHERKYQEFDQRFRVKIKTWKDPLSQPLKAKVFDKITYVGIIEKEDEIIKE